MSATNEPEATVTQGNVVPKIEPVVVQTDGGPISLEFDQQPSATQRDSAPATVPVGTQQPPVDTQPPAQQQQQATPVAATPQQAVPGQDQASQQYLAMLQHQAQQGQLAMQQLQALQVQVPALQNALAAAQSGTQQQIQSANAALDSQITEMFGENAPAVKKIISSIAMNAIQERVDPIQQQHHEILVQRCEQEKNQHAQEAFSELTEMGIPEKEAFMFVDTVRQNPNARQMNGQQFSNALRAMALKHLVNPFMRQQMQRTGQPQAQTGMSPGATTVVPQNMQGMSPTVPLVHPQIAAAEAAKQQGQLIVGSGSQPQAQEALTQAAIDERLLKQAWAM